MSMCLEKLIESVQSRAALWYPNRGDFYDRETVEKLWSEVANDVGFPVEDCMAKWTTLRDVFRHELINIGRFNLNDNIVSKWKYFKKLLFLEEVLIKPSLQYEEQSLKCSRVDDNKSQRYPDAEISFLLSLRPLMKQISKGKNIVIRRKILELFKEKEQKVHMKCNHRFLMSLQPLLRNLPYQKQIKIRIDIQRLFL